MAALLSGRFVAAVLRGSRGAFSFGNWCRCRQDRVASVRETGFGRVCLESSRVSFFLCFSEFFLEIFVSDRLSEPYARIL